MSKQWVCLCTGTDMQQCKMEFKTKDSLKRHHFGDRLVGCCFYLEYFTDTCCAETNTSRLIRTAPIANLRRVADKQTGAMRKRQSLPFNQSCMVSTI